MTGVDISAARGALKDVDREPGASKPDPIVVADNIVRQFGGLTAVDVEHVEIQRGVITALIGPNGAGQDDVLQPADRVRPAQRGHLVVQRRRLNKVPAYKVSRMGMVRTFQLTKVLSKLTVIENMRVGATGQKGERLLLGDVRAAVARPGERQHGEGRRPARAVPAHQEAGGLRRLAVRRPAQAARDGARPDGRPELVMLDEPMAGVNPALKQSLLGHVKSLRDEGRTVLFVEHDMDMVRDISDWVIVMAQGQIVAEGPPDTVMGDRRVIDAYLGSHHDDDLSEEMEAEILAAAQAEIEAERADEPPEDAAGGEPWLRPRPPPPTAARTSAAAEGAVLRADDLVAGYLPGVNILNGADLYCQEGELVGIIGPNGAGKSTLLKALFGLVKIQTGTVTLKGEDITNERADRLVTKGIGFVPQTNNVFPSLTIQENLEMGVYQRPVVVPEAVRVRRRALPRPARPPQPACRLAVGRRAADGGDGPRADDGAVRAAARRAVGRPLPRDAGRGLRPDPAINRAGVSVIMVEQNAARCLQISDRGYVLDQGRTPTPAPGRTSRRTRR